MRFGLATIVSLTAHRPAAALTSFARDEDRQLALQAGFHLHLTKPIDPRRLIEAVATLGGQRGAAAGAEFSVQPA